jgi:hypothetical protein
MGRIRKWINRDDGKWFRVGNDNLNLLETIGGLLMVFGFALVCLNRGRISDIPTWFLLLIFMAAIVIWAYGSIIKKN